MTFQNNTGFTQIDGDSGTATMTVAQPQYEILGGTNVTSSASGNTITLNGTGGGSGSNWTFISSFNVAGTSSYLQTGLGTYDEILMILDQNVSAAGTFVTYQISYDGGSTFSNIAWTALVMYNAATPFGYQNTDNQMYISATPAASDTYGLTGTVLLSGNLLAKKKIIHGCIADVKTTTTGVGEYTDSLGMTSATTTVDAINVVYVISTSGTISFWGR